MKRDELAIDPDQWADGLRQVAPNGTMVGVMPTKDGKAFFLHFETPVDDGAPHISMIALREETLAMALVLIAKKTGLWMPGLGVIRVIDGEPVVDGGA